MKCLVDNCEGFLRVVWGSFIEDDNGVYGQHSLSFLRLECSLCLAIHDADEGSFGGTIRYVTLTPNQRPEPSVKVYIEVEGGIVQEVLSDRTLGVVVRDKDIFDAGDPEHTLVHLATLDPQRMALEEKDAREEGNDGS